MIRVYAFTSRQRYLSHPSPQKRQQGMSLLELLVAVFIFAVAAGGLFKVIGENSRHTEQLELRFFAQLAANNALIELQLLPQWPSLGKRTDRVDLGGRRFSISRNVEATDNALIRKVTINTGLADSNTDRLSAATQPLAELQAFMGPTP